MTLQPVAPPHLLTAAEYLEIGEIEPGYSELVEGRLLMSPSPVPLHNIACSRMWASLDRQLPAPFAVVQDIDVDLELVPPDEPGSVRRPDVVVVRAEALDRVERDGGVIRAAEVVVAVEVVSPGSRRVDLVAKRHEYAEAGIPHYWIVDLSRPVTLVPCHLAGEFGYADDGAVTGTFTATTPFPVTIDLDPLR